ncbi:MAG: Co2+/Mg2+ efflux protein ApaG [Flavobacteriales bacterium]|nr:Co2+/Mg2+ efflux protein ApaG [Flavobacteriales bacterium]
MVKALTSGIEVSAQSFYESSYSSPEENRFIFSYQIVIENKSDAPFQLLRRKWEIFDSIGETRFVEGKGVIGEQPVILPGQTYTYRSACDLRSDFGKMSGSYLMVNKDSQDLIHAEIPTFELVSSWLLN